MLKYLFVDEVVFLLKQLGTAAVFEEMALTYRKLRVSAWFLAQQAKQLQSTAGLALLDNINMALFLEQESGEIAKMADVFAFSPAEVQIFDHVKKHAHWSSGYLRLAQQQGGIVRIVSNRMTDWMASQDPEAQRHREQAIADAGGDIRVAAARSLYA
jgi:hypothetical protein